MKRISIFISVILIILTAALFCSCAYAPVTETDRPLPEVTADNAQSGNGTSAASAPDMKNKEIIEVYIPQAAGRTSILPLFDYGDGYLRSDKAGGTPRTTYPVTVEYDGDFVTVHYYVEKSTGGAVQRSLVTGKDNVIIYYSEE